MARKGRGGKDKVAMSLELLDKFSATLSKHELQEITAATRKSPSGINVSVKVDGVAGNERAVIEKIDEGLQRATIETLSNVKNPRQFVAARQANIAGM